MIPEAARTKPLEIWFQDEARIGQKGTLAYIWARQGTRPRAVQDTLYISAYIYGAICPERGVGAGLVMPKANAEGLNDQLSGIEKAVAPGAHAVLIMDGAGWHNSKDFTVPGNISLLKLPAYAPELNPVEKVWQFLRRNKLAHRLYDTYEAIKGCLLRCVEFPDSRTRANQVYRHTRLGQSVMKARRWYDMGRHRLFEDRPKRPQAGDL